MATLTWFRRDDGLVGRLGRDRALAFSITRRMFPDSGKPFSLQCYLPGQPGSTLVKDHAMGKSIAADYLKAFLEGIE